jgi:hypothetical protein
VRSDVAGLQVSESFAASRNASEPKSNVWVEPPVAIISRVKTGIDPKLSRAMVTSATCFE